MDYVRQIKAIRIRAMAILIGSIMGVGVLPAAPHQAYAIERRKEDFRFK